MRPDGQEGLTMDHTCRAVRSSSGSTLFGALTKYISSVCAMQRGIRLLSKMANNNNRFI